MYEVFWVEETQGGEVFQIEAREARLAPGWRQVALKQARVQARVGVVRLTSAWVDLDKRLVTGNIFCFVKEQGAVEATGDDIELDLAEGSFKAGNVSLVLGGGTGAGEPVSPGQAPGADDRRCGRR